jgi:hypothetical protein
MARKRPRTYSTTATVVDMLAEVHGFQGWNAAGTIPLIVVVDGATRPVTGFDFWEEVEDGHVTGRAFVLETGAHDDPHPMWAEGLDGALAAHEREEAGLTTTSEGR